MQVYCFMNCCDKHIESPTKLLALDTGRFSIQYYYDFRFLCLRQHPLMFLFSPCEWQSSWVESICRQHSMENKYLFVRLVEPLSKSKGITASHQHIFKLQTTTLKQSCTEVYSCFDKGCPQKSVKACATMPKGSLGNTQ